MANHKDNFEMGSGSGSSIRTNDGASDIRVKRFMDIIGQLPRLCSPTICGTLSQPTTKTERLSRTRKGSNAGSNDMFEWSLEQKAILSPANITTDTDCMDEWQHMADLNPSWRQQESEMFFSQKTIAPSPMVTNNSMHNNHHQHHHHHISHQPYDSELNLGDQIIDEDSEEEREAARQEDDYGNDLDEDDDDDEDEDEDDDDMDDLSRLGGSNFMDDQSQQEYEFDEGSSAPRHELDDLFFSPQPLKSSQTQQRMDVFSPNTFTRVMEDENTLQSTPKTTGSQQRARHRSRADMLLD